MMVSGCLKNAAIRLLIASILFSAPVGTAHAADGIFTIGVVNSVPTLTPAFDGFKKGMAELGYTEGKQVKYIYHGLLPNKTEAIDAEINALRSQKVDLLLSLGNETTTRAKLAVQGTDVPILITGCNYPIESGFIESRIHPGGSITGVAGLPRTDKTLEWLKETIPGLKKIYLPINPEDTVSVVSLPDLKHAAAELGIELVIGEVRSVKEAASGIRNLPKDVQAVFLTHSPTLNPGSNTLAQAAIERKLPTTADLTLDSSVLLTFTIDVFAMGEKAARLAHQIHRGAKPGDIPFETADAFLIINLRTAEKIGIRVPDSILVLAKDIIR